MWSPLIAMASASLPAKKKSWQPIPNRNRCMHTLSLRIQEVQNPTPLNPTPATCHKRKRKLRCSFWNAALQKLHCNIGFSAVRKSFVPKAALQQTKNCTATSKSLRCRKVALSCRFPAGFKPPRLGTHVSDLLKNSRRAHIADNNRRSSPCCGALGRTETLVSLGCVPQTFTRTTPSPKTNTSGASRGPFTGRGKFYYRKGSVCCMKEGVAEPQR